MSKTSRCGDSLLIIRTCPIVHCVLSSDRRVRNLSQLKTKKTWPRCTVRTHRDGFGHPANANEKSARVERHS